MRSRSKTPPMPTRVTASGRFSGRETAAECSQPDRTSAIVRVTFCGTRGSAPASGPEFLRYGGNTSCVVLAQGGEVPSLILDAGSGLRRLSELLGDQLFSAGCCSATSTSTTSRAWASSPPLSTAGWRSSCQPKATQKLPEPHIRPALLSSDSQPVPG